MGGRMRWDRVRWRECEKGGVSWDWGVEVEGMKWEWVVMGDEDWWGE